MVPNKTLASFKLLTDEHGNVCFETACIDTKEFKRLFDSVFPEHPDTDDMVELIEYVKGYFDDLSKGLERNYNAES